MQSYGFQYRYNDKTISNSQANFKGKLDACAQKKEWFKSFLVEEPSDPMDRVYWKVTCQGLNDYFGERYKNLVMFDIKANHSIGNIFNWLRIGKKYQLSIPSIILCILRGLS